MNEVRTTGFPAMILAAGFGTRLAPVTDHVPKPLLPVGGKTLLDHAVEAVTRAGAGPVAVNTHHLADLVAGHLAGRPDAGRFSLSHEPEIMGTGGALDGARTHLQGHPFFLLHNADVLCDADLGVLVDEHERTGAEATLLLVDWPEVNSVTLGGDGAILAIGDDPEPPPDARRLTYTGIGVFGEEMLADIGPGFSSLVDPLVRAMAERPGAIRGYAPDGVAWHDLGTLGRWLAVQGSEPEQPAGPGTLKAITGHGSDRRFWRLAIGEWSAVAMASPEGDEEFDRFVEIGGFLGERGLGAPEIRKVEPELKTLLMADLGDASLYRLVKERGWDDDRVHEAYGLAVDRLAELQDSTDAARTACPAAVDRCLDYDTLRWETNYFRERFLGGHLGLPPEETAVLEDEFHALADDVARQPVVLIHRDFQSQNILLGEAGIGLVDFQGMRLGPRGYDLASLVFDPYVAMPAEVRRDLTGRFAAATGIPVEEVAEAGLQRVMQALGAYGFLGHVKGKTGFLSHVPRAVATLRALVGTRSMPVLEGFLARADDS